MRAAAQSRLARARGMAGQSRRPAQAHSARLPAILSEPKTFHRNSTRTGCSTPTLVLVECLCVNCVQHGGPLAHYMTYTTDTKVHWQDPGRAAATPCQQKTRWPQMDSSLYLLTVSGSRPKHFLFFLSCSFSLLLVTSLFYSLFFPLLI